MSRRRMAERFPSLLIYSSEGLVKIKDVSAISAPKGKKKATTESSAVAGSA